MSDDLLTRIDDLIDGHIAPWDVIASEEAPPDPEDMEAFAAAVREMNLAVNMAIRKYVQAFERVAKALAHLDFSSTSEEETKEKKV